MLNTGNLQLINTNPPRETLAYTDGKFVYKLPVSNKDTFHLRTWLEKQKLAKKVSDDLLKFKNNNYKIPRVVEVSDKDFFVKEELAVGTPLRTSFVESLSQKELDIIYKGLANFINDINQSRPVLSQKDTFEMSTNLEDEKMPTMKELLSKLEKYIPKSDLQIVSDAKDWFDVASATDASVVFSHGDINEHNVFFNKKTKELTIIDFAEAKYQNADYMFNFDYARLGWLDIERLMSEYEKLPKKQKVNIRSNPNIKNMRLALYNFKGSVSEFLRQPKVATKIRLEIIKKDIEKIRKLYKLARSTEELTKTDELMQNNTSSKIMAAKKKAENSK